MGIAEQKTTDTNEAYLDELAPGTELLQGQYRIVKFLNSGGFGITYLASDSLDRKVVIKECFPSSFCNRSRTIVQARSRAHTAELKSVVQLFVQEARSLAKLNHPNIVGVHQVFEDNETAYMVLDFVEGRDLLDTLEDPNHGLTAPQIKGILQDVLSAVGFIHDQDILHRDISPDNILLDSDLRPVLIDFGAAREEATKKSRVLSAMRVVKDGYSPQEFYVQGSEQSPSSDLYALGASFYHLIDGEIPPNSQARLAAIASGEKDPYEPLAGRIKGYETRFLAAIDKALGILPKDRMQTAEEWLDAMEGNRRKSRVVTQQLPKSSAAAATEQTKKRSALVPLLGSVAVVALLAVGGLAVTGNLSSFDEAEATANATTPATTAPVAVAGSTASPEPAAPVAEPVEEPVTTTVVEDTPVADEPTTEIAAAPEVEDVPAVAEAPVIEEAPATDTELAVVENETTPIVEAAPIVPTVEVTPEPEVAPTTDVAENEPVAVPSSEDTVAEDTAAVAPVQEVAVPEQPVETTDVAVAEPELTVPATESVEETATDTPPVTADAEVTTPAPVETVEAEAAETVVAETEAPAAVEPVAVEDPAPVEEQVVVEAPVEVIVPEIDAPQPVIADAPEAPINIATLSIVPEVTVDLSQNLPPQVSPIAAAPSVPVQDNISSLAAAEADIAAPPPPPVVEPVILVTESMRFGLPFQSQEGSNIIARAADVAPLWVRPGSQILAVNGVQIQDLGQFDQIAAGLITEDNLANKTVTFMVKPEDDDIASLYPWVLPITYVTSLPDGTTFETVKVNEEWVTTVTAAPGNAGEIQVGDRLVAHVESSQSIADPSSLRTVLKDSLENGINQFNFAVTREGSMWVVPMTYTEGA